MWLSVSNASIRNIGYLKWIEGRQGGELGLLLGGHQLSLEGSRPWPHWHSRRSLQLVYQVVQQACHQCPMYRSGTSGTSGELTGWRTRTPSRRSPAESGRQQTMATLTFRAWSRCGWKPFRACSCWLALVCICLTFLHGVKLTNYLAASPTENLSEYDPPRLKTF